jgi:hypothetical protein
VYRELKKAAYITVSYFNNAVLKYSYNYESITDVIPPLDGNSLAQSMSFFGNGSSTSVCVCGWLTVQQMSYSCSINRTFFEIVHGYRS